MSTLKSAEVLRSAKNYSSVLKNVIRQLSLSEPALMALKTVLCTTTYLLSMGNQNCIV